jgi:hypothetical protein
MRAQWDGGRRILLGGNSGGGAVTLRSITFQYAGVWISAGLPCVYIHILPYVYWTIICTELDLRDLLDHNYWMEYLYSQMWQICRSAGKFMGGLISLSHDSDVKVRPTSLWDWNHACIRSGKIWLLFQLQKAVPLLRRLAADIPPRRPVIPDQSLQGLWWTQWHWNVLLSEYVEFPVSINSRTIHIQVFHSFTTNAT